MSEVPTEIVERFSTYDFPGNVRELENLVRRLIVLGDPRYVLSELKDAGSMARAARDAPAPPPSSDAAPPRAAAPVRAGTPAARAAAPPPAVSLYGAYAYRRRSTRRARCHRR